MELVRKRACSLESDHRTAGSEEQTDQTDAQSTRQTPESNPQGLERARD